MRVTFEATVTYSYPRHGWMTVLTDDEREIMVNSPDAYVVEKITPDYKAQIEALEPGTAFMLTHAGKEFTYFRTDGDRIINQAEEALDIDRVVWLNSVTDIRILK